MANPRAIREAMATRLSSITGLTVHDSWPNGLPHPPCAIIDTVDAEPGQTFGRGDLTRWGLDVWLLVSLAPGNQQAIDNLDPYLATSSTGGIYGAIIADPTLGSVVDYTFVQSYRDMSPFEVDENVAYQGAIVSLECWSR